MSYKLVIATKRNKKNLENKTFDFFPVKRLQKSALSYKIFLH